MKFDDIFCSSRPGCRGWYRTSDYARMMLRAKDNLRIPEPAPVAEDPRASQPSTRATNVSSVRRFIFTFNLSCVFRKFGVGIISFVIVILQRIQQLIHCQGLLFL
jgi:hypothetical protein